VSRPPSAASVPRRRLLAASLALLRRATPAPISVALGLPHARAAAARAASEPIEGLALDVHDGDSFTMRADDGRRLRIRVSGIDAPEQHQPWAEQSRRHLGDLMRGRRLRIEPVKQDVFDRTVAKIWVLDDDAPPRDAGLSLIEAGLAWHFVRYQADQPPSDVPRYAQAERAARARRAGLWQDPAPEAPWDFRARLRRHEAAPERRPRRDPGG
jgi:endonuclease YncB( thermonuclease family)